MSKEEVDAIVAIANADTTKGKAQVDAVQRENEVRLKINESNRTGLEESPNNE